MTLTNRDPRDIDPIVTRRVRLTLGHLSWLETLVLFCVPFHLISVFFIFPFFSFFVPNIIGGLYLISPYFPSSYPLLNPSSHSLFPFNVWNRYGDRPRFIFLRETESDKNEGRWQGFQFTCLAVCWAGGRKCKCVSEHAADDLWITRQIAMHFELKVPPERSHLASAPLNILWGLMLSWSVFIFFFFFLQLAAFSYPTFRKHLILFCLTLFHAVFFFVFKKKNTAYIMS